MALSTPVKPYTHVNGTIADAAKVNANDDEIYSSAEDIVDAINLAAGSESSLDARLDIALNNDGTIKRNMVGLSGKNHIINGDFDIWQRAASQTSSGYNSDDRWTNSNSGSTKTHSKQSFALGQTSVPYEPAYYSRTVVVSVGGAANFVSKTQRCESVRILAGQVATLSFYAKVDASKNIAVELFQNFGTGGSPSSPVYSIGVTTCSLTTSWQKFTVTVNIPSISGKTLGTNEDDYLAVSLWFDAGSNYNARTNSLGQQSGTFDIAQVQLEEGSVATAFEQRSLGQEFALCQRYYEKGGVAATTYGTLSQSFKFSFRVTKRTGPTMTSSNWSYVNSSAGSVSGPTTQDFDAGVTVTTTANVGWAADWTADAEL